MKVYIAGPMRGIAQGNFPTFHKAEKLWRDAGHTVFSPARVATALGYDSQTAANEATIDHIRHVFQMDFVCIYAADALALLPNWEESQGATIEVSLALVLGLGLYDAETMTNLNGMINPLPWKELRCISDAAM